MAIGIGLALLELYLLVRWFAGPNLARVTPGPSVPPTWMTAAIRVAEVECVVLAVGVVHRFVVRPWRRERHIPFDGLLVFSTNLEPSDLADVAFTTQVGRRAFGHRRVLLAERGKVKEAVQALRSGAQRVMTGKPSSYDRPLVFTKKNIAQYSW